MKAQKTMIAATACFAALLMVSCKINKDANCLNPKASCYKKDTEAPFVTSTTPSSSPSGNVSTNTTLPTIIISYSEPMKNAGERSAYMNPVGGGNTMTIDSVTKINDQTYQLNLSGYIGNGSIMFDLSLVTDLAGNSVSPSQFNLTTSTIAAVPDTVTSIAGGYNETNIQWTNTTPFAMTYAIKIGGTDCGASSTAAAGINVGPGTPVAAGAVVTTRLAFGQFAIGANTVRICLTPAPTGSAASFSVTVNRNETVPTINTIASGRVKIPYSIVLTCTNVDRIIYTIDGSVPDFTVTSTGASVGAVASGSSLAYSIANGYSLTQRGAVPFRYLCIDKSGQKNTGGVILSNLQSKFVWDESNWAPVSPNDHWD